MALTLSEQQLARSEDRILTDKRIDRISGLRTPTVQGELLHYSDKYGRTLTDEQVQGLDKSQTEFLTSINNAKSDVNTARSNVERVYGENKTKLSSLLNGLASEQGRIEAQYSQPFEGFDQVSDSVTGASELIPWSVTLAPGETSNDPNIQQILKDREQAYYLDWDSKAPAAYQEWKQKYKEENLTRVTATNNGQPIGTYYMMPEHAAQLQQQTREAANQNWPWIVSGDPASAINIEVRGYGKEFYDIATPYTYSLDTALAKAYTNQLPQEVNQGLSQLETEYTQANATLSQRQQEITGYEQQNAQALTTMRMKYQEKLSNIKDTIGSMING